jgi:hypothetical protein
MGPIPIYLIHFQVKDQMSYDGHSAASTDFKLHMEHIYAFRTKIGMVILLQFKY